MLKTIKLTNFRRHQNLYIEFGPGVNAIRGRNEQGKTTILEGISYAFGGAAALPEPLSDVVTYGLTESKLAVEVRFDFNGVDYTLKRSKGGAELVWDSGIVTGQTAVSAEVARLFGSSIDTMTRLQIAKQNEVRGTLDDDPVKTNQLITYLANLDLLDSLIEKATAKWPVNDAKNLAHFLAELVEQMAESTEQVKEAEAQLIERKVEAEGYDADHFGSLKQALEQLRSESSALKSTLDVNAAQRYSELVGRLETAEAQVARLTNQKGLIEVIEPVDPNQLAEAIRIESSNDKVLRAQEALAQLNTAHTRSPAVAWQSEKATTRIEALEEFTHELTDAHQKLTDVTKRIQAESLVLAGLKGQVLKDSRCGFCQRDLSDVPEAVKIAKELADQIAKVEANLASLQALKAELEAEAEAYDSVASQQAVQERSALALAGYVELEDSANLPSGLVWSYTGYLEFTPLQQTSAQLREQMQRAESAAAMATYIETTLKAASDEVLVLKQGITEAYAAHQKAVSVCDAISKLDAQQVQLESQIKEQISFKEMAESRVAWAEKTLAVHQEQLNKLLAKQVDLTERVEESQRNAELINKLRDCRPKLAAKVWEICLAGVSEYTGKIRGETSIITREDKRFLINGHPVKGLSGSGKDSLGLAIRLALVKLFIPFSDFLILDEVAAACEDVREAAMLATLAQSGVPQIILVTHSDLCDAYADQVIKIGENSESY